MTTQCPHCKVRMRIPDDRLGAEVTCPACKESFTAEGAPATSVSLPTRTVQEELAIIEARTTAKEVASKYIGKHAVPWIVLLVAMGVGASYFLPAAALPAVIGLVSTAAMALIALVTGITGLKEKEERPEFAVIRELISRMDKPKESMNVEVEDDKVKVKHGDNVVSAARVTVDPHRGIQLRQIPVEDEGGPPRLPPTPE